MDLVIAPNQIHSTGRVDFNSINLSKCLDKDPAVKNLVPRVYAMVKIEKTPVIDIHKEFLVFGYSNKFTIPSHPAIVLQVHLYCILLFFYSAF